MEPKSPSAGSAAGEPANDGPGKPEGKPVGGAAVSPSSTASSAAGLQPSSAASSAASSAPSSSSSFPGFKHQQHHPNQPGSISSAINTTSLGQQSRCQPVERKDNSAATSQSSSSSAESSTGGFVNKTSSIIKTGIITSNKLPSGLTLSPPSLSSAGQKSHLIKEGDTLVRVRIKSGSNPGDNKNSHGHPLSPPGTPTTGNPGYNYSRNQESRGSILATKMAEHTILSPTGWPNNKDDYELGEVIGTF